MRSGPSYLGIALNSATITIVARMPATKPPKNTIRMTLPFVISASSAIAILGTLYLIPEDFTQSLTPEFELAA